MSKNDDMIKLVRLFEGTQFAGEPEQKPGDQVRGTDKAVVKGKQHPFHNRLVGEEISLEDKLSKRYQDLKDVQAKEKEQKKKEELDEQGVAESYPKHQDLSGISTDKLKAYLAKQGQQQSSGEGNQVKRVRAELQRREQGVAEAIGPDVMRHQGDKTIKIVKRAGKTIGEIGIDAEASPGNGSYYVKMYDGSYDAAGFETAEEALAELKDIIKQGVAEGSGPKEKQKTPYRDINSPEYRAAADKQKQRMAKDKAAEPGKKMLAKQGAAETQVNELSKGTLKSYSKAAGQEVLGDLRDAGGARDMAADKKKHGDTKAAANWDDEASWLDKRAEKRAGGVAKATTKIAKKGVPEGNGRNSYAYSQDGGANDERHDLDPSEWYIVKDGKMYKVTVYPRQEQEAISRGYSPSREEAKAKAGQQGVAEGVAESMPLSDAVKVLRHYGADHFKTGSETLNFYKNGRPLSVDLIWNDDATRSVSISQLNSVTRRLKGQGVEEGYLDNDGQEHSPAAQAITRRILRQRTDLLSKYGPEKVMNAIDEVAEFVGDVEEIGSSDVSGWIRHVEQILGNIEEGVAEAGNPTDKITVDVPLMIRIMEYAREDAQDDMDLHNVAEQLVRLSAMGKTLGMDDYDGIVGMTTEQKLSELGAVPPTPPQGTATAPAAATGNTTPTSGSVSPDEQTALNKIQTNPAMKQQFDKLMTQATPGAANKPAVLDPAQTDALEKIKTNAGLKGQYDRLIKQANPTATP